MFVHAHRHNANSSSSKSTAVLLNNVSVEWNKFCNRLISAKRFERLNSTIIPAMKRKETHDGQRMEENGAALVISSAWAAG